MFATRSSGETGLKLRRHLLYLWRDNFRAEGPSALRTRGWPGKSVVLAKAPVVATDDLSLARQRIAELERKVGQQQLELRFFSTSLAASRGKTPADRRVWRKAIYAVIEAMTGVPQGELTVARLCALSHLGPAGYYRHLRASAPCQEENGVRDAIQRIALKNRFYGYRRIRAELRREGFLVNHKRIQRLMRQDNLLCLRKRPFVPVTRDSQHGWSVAPNLARYRP